VGIAQHRPRSCRLDRPWIAPGRGWARRFRREGSHQRPPSGAGIVSIGPRRDRYCPNSRYDAALQRMKRRASCGLSHRKKAGRPFDLRALESRAATQILGYAAWSPTNLQTYGPTTSVLGSRYLGYLFVRTAWARVGFVRLIDGRWTALKCRLVDRFHETKPDRTG
jgi:hypothetical protein